VVVEIRVGIVPGGPGEHLGPADQPLGLHGRQRAVYGIVRDRGHPLAHALVYSFRIGVFVAACQFAEHLRALVRDPHPAPATLLQESLHAPIEFDP
jgi:hypothetical protein